ncbi:zinc-dependent peptidase [Parasulfuritortus cantonensis]|uniref:Zinc-dependent peptidase n=1 Tax=Parasulfuritortus cantonensis TaxID=2528202 RepID=A0A4R1BKP5_9PROT|nr:M90 family metallopeptidase [Parasulfuritortus cantonensis]TCJ17899.1 zinc-dependent peptidase [Parasulfuritortus cantonensis]
MAGFLKSLFSAGQSLQLDPGAWAEALALPVFDGLAADDAARLRELAGRLLADKTFSGAAGHAVDAAMATRIAAFAALPVLNLGYDWYKGWSEVIVYPAEFVPEREIVDDYGIVHRVRQPLSGEAWEGGPLVLSWDDVLYSGGGQGYNVVIHEFAHKLDMKNGAVDGLPPLHSGLAVADWAAAFGQAYADFCRRVDAGEETAIDPYASESPAEFFAVLSECFFEMPDVLADDYPALYERLRRFYKQDPLSRLESSYDTATT